MTVNGQEERQGEVVESAASRAISLDRAGVKAIRIGNEAFDVWVVPDMDELIDAFLAQRESESFDPNRTPFGATMWPSGKAFANWAARHFEIPGNPLPLRALELGCGVGFLSCWLAHRGVAEVTATDHEQALGAFVLRNAESFGVEGKVTFQALDWEHSVPEAARGAYPFLVACDVLYENEHLKSLPRVAAELLAPDGVFYLADPERFRFQAAVAELRGHFPHIEETTVHVENGTDDISQGVVNAGAQLSRVRILACRKRAPIQANLP